MKRTKTGIKGLDKLLNGGIPKNHVVLLSGQTGAGKSILGLEYIVKGALNYGEKGIFISFEQSKDDIISQAKEFGWKIKDLEEKDAVRILTFKPSKAHIGRIVRDMENKVKEFNPSRLVFDSISTYGVYAETLGYFEEIMSLGLKKEEINLGLTPESVSRKTIMNIMEKIKSFGVTSLVISELPEESNYLSRDTISEFLADGVIILSYLGIGGTDSSTLQIRKMRQTNHEKGFIPFEITSSGIKLKPEEKTTTVLK